jgi:hypothetical protein
MEIKPVEDQANCYDVNFEKSDLENIVSIPKTNERRKTECLIAGRIAALAAIKTAPQGFFAIERIDMEPDNDVYIWLNKGFNTFGYDEEEGAYFDISKQIDFPQDVVKEAALRFEEKELKASNS